jgi:plasmid stabilization system protein ParE
MAPWQVVFRPEAVDDVLEVQAWYESRRVGLGQEFNRSLDALIGRIASNPDMFRRVHGATRRAVMSRFPYAVYFRTSDAQVVVLAIHGRQHPSRWKSRA